jgi:hypothetical protein
MSGVACGFFLNDVNVVAAVAVVAGHERTVGEPARRTRKRSLISAFGDGKAWSWTLRGTEKIQ